MYLRSSFHQHMALGTVGILCALVMAGMWVGFPAATAGPVLLPEAKPRYQDPLSTVRPDTVGDSAEDSARPSPVRPQGIASPGDSGFTIVGDQKQDGLEKPGIDDLTRTVRNEFLGQSAQQPPVNSDDAPLTGENASPADLIRTIVNTVPGEGGGGGSSSSGRGSSSQGEQGLIASVIDMTLIDLIGTILNPRFETEGMVTFSIAGFGDFALLLLQESGGLFIVDLDGGTAIKISEGSVISDAGRVSQGSQGQRNEDRGPSNALQRLLELLERNVVPIVTSPITLATIVLFSMIWIIWRLSARE